MTTKGVEDGMGATRTCGCTGEFGCFICDIRGQRPRATPAMKDEVESATPRCYWCGPIENCHSKCPSLSAPVESATSQHDFIPCDNVVCKRDPQPEHCIYVWCGAPRNHPSHAGYAAQPSPTLKDEVYATTFAYSPEHKRCVYCDQLPEDHQALPGPHFCPREGRKPFSEGEWRTTVYEPVPEEPDMRDEVYAMLDSLDCTECGLPKHTHPGRLCDEFVQPTFAYSLAMYLTRNGQQGNAPEMQAEIEQFLRERQR